MRILADHCVAKDVVAVLRESGLDVVRAGDIGMADAPDEDIFQCAVKERRILLTSDKDFGNVKRFRITESYGVVVVLVGTMTKATMLQIVISFFRRTSEETLHGRLAVISANRVRLWPEGKAGLPAVDPERSRGAEAGYVALLSVLIVSSIAAATILIIFITSLGTSLSSGDVSEGATARMHADGCAERALQLLTNGSSNPCSTFCTVPTLTFPDGGRCTIVGIVTAGPNWRIRTTGVAVEGNITKYIEIMAFRSAPGAASQVLSWKETDGAGF